MKFSIIQKILFVLVLLTLSIFSNGQYAIFFAIWILVTMLLFTVRNLTNRWQKFAVAFIFTGIAYYIGFDVVPFIPIYVSIFVSIIFSVFASLPYLIDSYFSKQRSSFFSTFIFPCSAVLLEYAYHLINQYGTWGHFAYTQQSQHILLQSISIFGMGYITFLITWFASVCNWIYEQRKVTKNVKKAMLIYVSILGLTLIYGMYRVHLNKYNTKTIKVASISALDNLAVSFEIAKLNEKEVKIDAKAQTKKLNTYLFNKSIEEAKAGAKVVFWAEGNGVVIKEDEQDLYNKASSIALEHRIYLGIAVAIIDHSNDKYLENKFVVFDTKGLKVIDYWKGISVPGAEASISNNKPTGIQKIETDNGIIAGAICFDLDFPLYIRSARGADILLAPSNDWKKIDPMHTDMAKYRAIEQGFNLIRQTSNGLSIGTDYTGKVLSEMDHFNDNNKVLNTQLPTKGVRTIYSIIGDSFIVFCLFLLLLSIFLLKKNKQNAD